jgi:beta-glucosidase
VTPAPPAGTVNVSYYGTQDAAAAVAAAAGADLVIIVVATDSSEGSDRKTMGFPGWMDDMVFNLSAAYARNTVVVARCPGACTMPWAAAAPAILFELLAGQESGNSIANTIFGGNNPSGKLPVTFPQPAPAGAPYPTDTWLSPPGGGPVIPTSFPGTDRGRGFPEVDFAEGLFMGYRWYDAQGTAPAFAFGHGLSYSTFSYAPLVVPAAPLTPAQPVVVTTSVCNTAGPAGAEVAQLYVGFPAAANEPPKLLKGFQKVSVAPGECAGVAFPLAAEDLWIWDVVAQQWTLTPGTYTLNVGSSSRDIRVTGTLTVTA